MRSRDRSPDYAGWREIASLGEQLASATSLTAQSDRIISMTSRLIRGRVDVWLNENLFRLPDWDAARAFPAQPRAQGMRRALARRKLYVQRTSRKAHSRRAL